jgi:RimJ/RimL family protein N-acetyltransferase
MNIDIQLRKVVINDIDEEYCSWYVNDDNHLRYFTGSGRSFDRKVIIDDFETGELSGSHFYYLIESADGSRIGNVKIGPIDKRNKTSDLVCLIGNRLFVGKGIANRAISLANRIAFENYDIRRLHGGMHEHNIPSIRAYTKAGWFIEATMKGYYFVNDTPVDRVCVACLNPKYFDIA